MPELGNRYDCYSCGAKFYDLGKPEPICPKCGANQKDSKPTHAPEVSAARKRRKEEATKREPEVVEDDVVIPDDDADVVPTPEDDGTLEDDTEVEDFADDHEE